MVLADVLADLLADVLADVLGDVLADALGECFDARLNCHKRETYNPKNEHARNFFVKIFWKTLVVQVTFVIGPPIPPLES